MTYLGGKFRRFAHKNGIDFSLKSHTINTSG